MSGHAGFGADGRDIVCAAVSSAAYLTVNTITDVLALSPLLLYEADGEMRLMMEEKDAPACRTIFCGLKLHLTNLEEQYPQNLRVNYNILEADPPPGP